MRVLFAATSCVATTSENELLTAAKDVRSSAYDSIRYNKRLYDCLDAVKVSETAT